MAMHFVSTFRYLNLDNERDSIIWIRSSDAPFETARSGEISWNMGAWHGRATLDESNMLLTLSKSLPAIDRQPLLCFFGSYRASAGRFAPATRVVPLRESVEHCKSC